MCTDKTLKAKIRSYNKITEEYNAVKVERDKLAAAILAEIAEREKTMKKDDIKKTFGVFRVAFDKADIKNDVVKTYAPELWEKYHTTTKIEYIRKA